MNIIYIGAGYVGACSGAASADSGHQVLAYDIDKEKIEKLSSGDKDKIESCLFEEGLGELIIRNRNRLHFTSSLVELKKFLDEAQAIFMCLPTPEKDETGATNMEYYEDALKTVAKIAAKRNNGTQSQYLLIVNKSTVPINTSFRTKEILDSHSVVNYGIGSNPEFLVEGKALEGSMRPERIVVGAWQEKDFEILRSVYKRYSESPQTLYIETNPPEAEAGKILANFILFNRVVNCYDVVGRLCEKFDSLHFENVRKILISDKRIGSWGFYDSLFAGGSCFIKDARSLAYQLEEKKVNADIVKKTLEGNMRQVTNFLARAETELGFNWSGETIGILGLAFKRDTNDIRNSGAIHATKFLLEKDVKMIKAFDPVAGRNFRRYFPDGRIILVESELEAIKGVDVLIIATDWPQFRELAEVIIREMPKGSLLMDGRRMLQSDYQRLKEAGYSVIAVGSPVLKVK